LVAFVQACKDCLRPFTSLVKKEQRPYNFISGNKKSFWVIEPAATTKSTAVASHPSTAAQIPATQAIPLLLQIFVKYINNNQYVQHFTKTIVFLYEHIRNLNHKTIYHAV